MFYEKLHDETAKSPNLDPGNLGTNSSCITSQLYHLGGILCPNGSQFANCKMDHKNPYPLEPLPGLDSTVHILSQMPDL